MSRLDRQQWSTATTYPNKPGSVFGSRTSKAAADSIAPKMGKLHELVLSAFHSWGEAGLTDEQLDESVGMSRTLRPRRIELTAQGYLKDSGKTRATASGRQATVWVLA